MTHQADAHQPHSGVPERRRHEKVCGQRADAAQRMGGGPHLPAPSLAAGRSRPPTAAPPASGTPCLPQQHGQACQVGVLAAVLCVCRTAARRRRLAVKAGGGLQRPAAVGSRHAPKFWASAHLGSAPARRPAPGPQRSRAPSDPKLFTRSVNESMIAHRPVHLSSPAAQREMCKRRGQRRAEVAAARNWRANAVPGSRIV